MTEIGQRIKATRGPLTQAQFADRLEVTSKTVLRWEAGTGLPDGESLLALLQHFDVNPAWLLTGNGEPPSLTAEEITLLQAYRGLPEVGRRALMAMAAALAAGAPAPSGKTTTAHFHAEVGHVSKGDNQVFNYGDGRRNRKGR